MAAFRNSCSLLLLACAGASYAQHFPPLDVDNPPKSRIVKKGDSFCMTARNDISANSPQPLFTYDFAAPGASGVVMIDGKTIKTFKDERHLLVYAHVLAGDHIFQVRFEKPAENTFMSHGHDLKHCTK